MGIRRGVKVFPVLLRLVHQPRFRERLQASFGLLRDEPSRLHLQLHGDTAQVDSRERCTFE